MTELPRIAVLAKQLRLLLGLTQAEIAILTGVHPNTVSGVERGKHGPSRHLKSRLWLLAKQRGFDGLASQIRRQRRSIRPFGWP